MLRPTARTFQPLRPSLPILSLRPTLRPPSTRLSSTTTPPPRRRAITLTTDTGRDPWTTLTAREKATRATTTTFNLSLILLGVVLTGSVAYILYLEVFSRDSKTALFNTTADRVRKDPRCLDLLCGPAEGGKKRDVSASGEPSHSRWARNRALATRHEKGVGGWEHTHLRFYVEGSVARGTVRVHVARGPEGGEWEVRELVVEVPGRGTVELEKKGSGVGGEVGKLFGVRWR
ncbi:hypothetical protein B0A50_02187 [Salinomyces thailandicus]|uniref:Mitochondrial import inner membrane translocase subunit Tim21 n=1 Tax=Salinomyces thailandicus TaxID=706561 RepID=A0A4U0U9I8_9PEZI|nr:hypothetical protein B0A50_02187 [Salinomyces thailandica]